MKTNIEILAAAAFLGACIACAQDQPAGPSVAPANKTTTAKIERSHSVVVKPAPSAYGQMASDYAYAVSSSYSGSSVPPVVIQFTPTDAATTGDMEEHLAIMTQIIDRAVERMGENEVDEKLGVKLTYTSGGKSVRALYLQGFGPLFMVKVNFPVHSPGNVETKAPEVKEDSEWERVRRQLYGVDRDPRWGSSSSSGVPYMAARADALKKQLIDALKNASNMKGVKSDEHINVSVFGSPAALDSDSYGRGSAGAPSTAPPRSVGSGRSGSGAGTTLEVARATLQGTVLTLRVKKSDADAAAKGTLDDEAFAKKVTVNTYAGNGHGLASVNSWIRNSSSSGLRAR